MALTQGRPLNECLGPLRAAPMAAATKIYAGSMVALNAAGNAVEPSVATGLVVVGVATSTVDNTDGDVGDKMVEYKIGTFIRDNNVGDEVTKADVGALVYAIDGGTISKTSTGRSAAGVLVSMDDLGPMVQIGIFATPVG